MADLRQFILARMREIADHPDPSAKAGLVSQLRIEHPDCLELITEANTARIDAMRGAALEAYRAANALPREDRRAAHAAVRAMYPEVITGPVLIRNS